MTSLRRRGPVWRIALASSVLLACTVTALALTLWSYHGAAQARQRAQHAQHASDTAQRAGSDLLREREAMNEYLLTPLPKILREIFDAHDDFGAGIAELRRGSVGSQRSLISTA